MKNKKLQITLLLVLVLAFLYNSYFFIPQKYQKTAEKYLTTALYFPADIINFYGKKIIVFAPHCDDETLGCGGMIQKAVNAGAKVYVVLITNGDGFKYAAEAEFKKFKPSPQNYIKFAYMRQNESLQALAMLGVKNTNIFFLGYPDRGIASMWRENWTKNNPYLSPFTRKNFSPYINSFSRNTEYCGENLLSDIEKILNFLNPDMVYVPHDKDKHPDHWATNRFVTEAVKTIAAKNKKHGSPQILLYLVHHGRWPVPSGKHLDMPLIPPPSLSKNGEIWEILPLSKDETEQKFLAIKKYKTQLVFMKNYLFSFARENELFCKQR